MAKNLQTNILIGGKALPSIFTAFNLVSSKMAGVQNNASTLGKVSSAATRAMNTAFMAVGVGAGAAFAGLTVVAKKSIGLASDLQEVQNVVDVTFGKNADQINAWSKTALKSFGLAELQAKQFTGTMGAMLKSSGLADKYIVPMSTSLAGLAGDMASFYNLDHSEAWEKIRSGISGETEPLRALGINMSVANLEAFALAKGIKTAYQDMDQASQTALRYSYLMEKSKDAQGDFARTQGSYSNQMRLLKNNFDQFTATLATHVLPTLTKGVQYANSFISSIADNPAKMKMLEDGITGAVNGVTSFVTEALPKAREFFFFVKDNWPTIEAVAKGVGLAFATWKVGTAVYEAYTVSKLLYGAIGTLAVKYSAASTAYGVYHGWKLKDMADTIILQGMYAKDAIVMGAKTLAMWGMTAATTAWTAVTTVATAVGTAFGAVMAFITSPIGLVILAIAALIGIVVLLYKNWDTVSAFMVGIWQNYVMPFFAGIGEWFSGIWTGLVSGFQNAWTGITDWFRNLWEGILGIVKGYANIYLGIFNFIIDGLNKVNFTVPDWVPFVGGKSVAINIPKLPTFAQGGFATGPSIFGEVPGVTEAAIPIKPGNQRSIGLWEQTGDMLGVYKRGSALSRSGAEKQFVFAPQVSGGNAEANKEMLRELFPEFVRYVKESFAEEEALAL